MTESANESQMESPPPSAPRGASNAWGLIATALLAGVLIGYIVRPYLEARLPEKLQAAARLVNQQLPAQPTEVAALATSVITNAIVATTSAPMLITPTPDRSGEMMQYLIANTQHFSGSVNAPVVMIEFSDFQ